MPSKTIKKIGVKKVGDSAFNTKEIGAEARNIEVSFNGSGVVIADESVAVNKKSLADVLGNVDSLLENAAPIDHSNAEGIYGVASNTVYGHVKLGSSLETKNGLAEVKFAEDGKNVNGLAVEASDSRLTNDRKNPKAVVFVDEKNQGGQVTYDGSAAVTITAKTIGAADGDDVEALQGDIQTVQGTVDAMKKTVDQLNSIIFAKPSLEKNEFTYSGKEFSPTYVNYDDTKMAVSGDVKKTDPGEYKITFIPKSGFSWMNDSNEPIEFNWKINKMEFEYTEVCDTDEEVVSTDVLYVSKTTSFNLKKAFYFYDGKDNPYLEVSNVLIPITAKEYLIANYDSSNSVLHLTGKKNGSTNIILYFSESKYMKAGSIECVVEITGIKTIIAVVDQTNSNPATCVTVTNGFAAKSADWDEFFGHYPVLLKDGKEVVKLNPNNFAQDINGNAVDITSGNAGDVMIAFPRRGLKISNIDDKITIEMTNAYKDSNFSYNAHTRNDRDLDVFYVGAYKGSVVNNRLRSLSGKTPQASQTIGTFRIQAQANGSGYEQSTFYQLIFRQCMYILKYQNLNSQNTLGMGNVNSSLKSTGNTNTKGMDYGTTLGSEQMKLFGIEDFWGNIFEWIDGLYCNSNYHIMTSNNNFKDNGSGYTDNGAFSYKSGYPNRMTGTTNTGFNITSGDGSTTTYWSDSAYLAAGYLPGFGGNWDRGVDAGAFCLRVILSASGSYSYLGARLSYY